MTKVIGVLLALLYLVSACAHNPYRNRVLDDGQGGKKKYFFAYGKFCGPGYPPLRQGYAKIAEETVAMWPPDDELDAMCYSHDLCYEDGGSTRVCDDALHKMLLDSQGEFKGDGCFHLANDMTIAFFAHCNTKGKTRKETIANRTSCWTFGLASAVVLAAMSAPFEFSQFPTTENSCSTGENNNLRRAVHTFEYNYQESKLNESHAPITIPMPRSE